MSATATAGELLDPGKSTEPLAQTMGELTRHLYVIERWLQDNQRQADHLEGDAYRRLRVAHNAGWLVCQERLRHIPGGLDLRDCIVALGGGCIDCRSLAMIRKRLNPANPCAVWLDALSIADVVQRLKKREAEAAPPADIVESDALALGQVVATTASIPVECASSIEAQNQPGEKLASSDELVEPAHPPTVVAVDLVMATVESLATVEQSTPELAPGTTPKDSPGVMPALATEAEVAPPAEPAPTPTTPDDPAWERLLSHPNDRHWKHLDALIQLKGAGLKVAVSRAAIAEKAQTGNHDSDCIEQSFEILIRYGLMTSKRRAGCEPTALGRAVFLHRNPAKSGNIR